jgi:hypothetical protein
MRFSSLGVVDADDRWRRVYEEWRSNGSCGAIGLFGNARRRRSDYVKYRENERVFLLYHADNLCGLLPKSWFSGLEQMAELRRLAAKAGGGRNAAVPAL